MVREVLRRVGAFLVATLLAGYSAFAYSVTVSFLVPDVEYVNVLSGGQCPGPLTSCEAFDDPTAAATAQVSAICAQSTVPKWIDCTLLRLRATPGLIGPYGPIAYGADYSYIEIKEGFPDQLVFSATDIYFFYQCPSGYQFNGFNLCFSTGLVPPKNQCTDGTCCVGNPINPGAGGKTEIQTDYVGSGAFPLQFRRAYNSRGEFSGFRIGQNWRHTYDREIKVNTLSVQSFPPGIVASARALRPDGRVYYFSFNGTVWSGDPDVPDRLIRLVDATGATTGYRYTTADDTVESYDAAGKLLSIANRAGLQQTLSYDASGRLDHVTDPFGRTLGFEYDGANRIVSVIDPAGNRFGYGYDAGNNLTAVQYPDGTSRQYLYNESALTGGVSLPNALTGFTDEKGARYATWTYDAQGRAVASEHAGGAAKVQVSFNLDGTSTVTDALGTSRSYGFQLQYGVMRNTAISQPCTSCGASSSATTYDSNGFVASRTDFNGNVTQYTHDARGLELSRTEAADTPQARTITTSWHSSFNLPLQISETGRRTSFIYDISGNLLQKTVVAGTKSRTWTYTYNGNGQVLTIDGPRTDLSDVTTYTYDAQGNVATATNAFGQRTQFGAYDAHGRPLTIVDPNGLVVRLAYDVRGRLTSRDAGGAVTSYDYDPAGLISRVTLPDGGFLAYTYDPAQRLVGIDDRLGNRIAYTLDAMGNRVKEEAFDSAGQLARTRSRVFDGLNRLAQEIGAQSQITSYDHDDNGNITAATDPLQHTVANTYDALNRLIAVTDPAGGRTQYAYSALDLLTRVTDPRNVATAYGFDGVDLTQTQSPDGGLTTTTYDSAGNLLSSIDAKGQATSYRYDALNRLVGITYADGSQATYTYDQGVNGLGRLTQIADGGSTLALSYDVNGRVVAKQQTVISTKTTLNTIYSYNSAGQITSMTYPSGRVLQFAYDVQGQPSAIQVDGRPLIADTRYQPFSGLQGFRLAAISGQPSYVRQFDLDGRIASYTFGNTSIAVGYDAASRVAFLADTAVPANAVTYGYDALDRLTQAVMPNNVEAFQYDANGNRLSKTIGLSTDVYGYAPDSNRLLQITGSQVRSYSTDANGSVTADGVNQYVYDVRGRLFQADSAAGTTRYIVNALGQRVAKIGPVTGHHFPRKPGHRTPVAVFAYDEGGRLLGEYDASGVPRREYVWLGNTPVAVLKPNAAGGTDIFAIHADHLNTPRLIADQQGQTVWRWDNQEPFGSDLPNDDPGNTGTPFVFNLRFPGQYFDRETFTHYNMARDYSPAIGRYIQSDPIGLGGGIDTFAYVLNDPLRRIDPKGLATVIIGPGGIPILVPVPPPGSSPQGSKPSGSSGIPPELDPNPAPQKQTPIVTPPEPLPPEAPKPPGTGCRAIFDACMKGAQACPIPGVKQGLFGICFALWLACEATHGF